MNLKFAKFRTCLPVGKFKVNLKIEIQKILIQSLKKGKKFSTGENFLLEKPMS